VQPRVAEQTIGDLIAREESGVVLGPRNRHPPNCKKRMT